jgi:hypothetical protein
MVAITVKTSGLNELQADLRRLNPKENVQITSKGFEDIAFAIQRNAANKQIVAGGRGKKNAVPPLPSKLTSRTGTGRRSIRVNRGPLPRAIEIGTDLKYMSLHEVGGSADHKTGVVREHKRKVVFGKKVKPFIVPAHFRSGYTADYPKRSFLEPAYEAIRPRMGEIIVKAWRKEAKL